MKIEKRKMKIIRESGEGKGQEGKTKIKIRIRKCRKDREKKLEEMRARKDSERKWGKRKGEEVKL